jgi:hypothetical protein
MREVYAGRIIVIDDNSWCGLLNKEICIEHDASHIYNIKRLGVPKSKMRGFRRLQKHDFQFWFDDDCFPLSGWMDAFMDGLKKRPHLNYIHSGYKRAIGVDEGLVEFSGTPGCFMAFSKEAYPLMDGFDQGFALWGHWHGYLSRRFGGYYSIPDAANYIYSCDVDGWPDDYDGPRESSMTDNQKKVQLDRFYKMRE